MKIIRNTFLLFPMQFMLFFVMLSFRFWFIVFFSFVILFSFHSLSIKPSTRIFRVMMAAIDKGKNNDINEE